MQLAMNAKEHPEEWANTTIADYLEQMAGWIDDCRGLEDDIGWGKVDCGFYSTFAKILYMGKIYE